MWRETAQEMFAMLLKGIDALPLEHQEAAFAILSAHLAAAAGELATKTSRELDADRVRQN